jgi:hypothetical protein
VRANAFALEGPCFVDRLFEAATCCGFDGLHSFTILQIEHRGILRIRHREYPDTAARPATDLGKDEDTNDRGCEPIN